MDWDWSRLKGQYRCLKLTREANITQISINEGPITTNSRVGQCPRSWESILFNLCPLILISEQIEVWPSNHDVQWNLYYWIFSQFGLFFYNQALCSPCLTSKLSKFCFMLHCWLKGQENISKLRKTLYNENNSHHNDIKLHNYFP